MKSFKEKIAVLLLFVTPFFGLAQEAMPTSGGNASGSGGSLSYTIGQVAFTYQSSLNGYVSQGVQQPYEISVALATEEAIGITLNCIVYPNPTTSNVILKINNHSIENLVYYIFDVNGKEITSNKIANEETIIYTENFAVATYFITITDSSKTLKTFKIIKN